jgi:hypothetical protein
MPAVGQMTTTTATTTTASPPASAPASVFYPYFSLSYQHFIFPKQMTVSDPYFLLSSNILRPRRRDGSDPY